MEKTKYKILIVSILIVIGMVIIFDIAKEESKAAVFRLDRTSIQLDRHVICRNVINGTTQSLMIPTMTQAEWCSFLNRAGALGLSLSNCVTCYWYRCWCGNCSGWVCQAYNANPCPVG